MARARSIGDTTILEMALVGYQVEMEKIDKRIHEIRLLLKGKRPSSLTSPDHSGKAPVKRFMSEEARERIAAAQRKRWAEHRKLKAKAARES